MTSPSNRPLRRAGLRQSPLPLVIVDTPRALGDLPVDESSAVDGGRRTPVDESSAVDDWHLDERVREIGKAGLAEARAIIARATIRSNLRAS